MEDKDKLHARHLIEKSAELNLLNREPLGYK